MAASFCRRSFLNYKNCLFQTQKRTGYVVLIPETPEDIKNSTLDCIENLPDYTKISAKTCSYVVNTLAQQCEVGYWELLDISKQQNLAAEYVFKNILEPLEVLSIPFLSSWGITRCLHYSNSELVPPNILYPLSDKVLQIRSDKYNSPILYSLCKEALEKNSDNFTEEQNRILRKFVWEGFLCGLDLNTEKKEKLTKCLQKMERSRKIYNQKMIRAKSSFKQVITDKQFAEDSPLDFLRNTAVNPAKPLKGPWVITLMNSVYMQYLEYCPSSEARKHIWCSFNQLLSQRGDKTCVAKQEMNHILDTKMQFANLLGYPSYVHMTMKNRMADSLEHVESVLSEILECAKQSQEKEIYELEKFAYANEFRQALDIWDINYWKRLHLRDIFGLDELVLRDYFPLSQVLLGLIALCEQLFGIIIEENSSAEAWYPNVRYFRILDEKTKEFKGGFYLDPYAAPGKADGESTSGHFLSVRPKSKICNSFPLSALIFNFSPPENDKPSLLYFREVVHLFERFGQMLQHTLTDTTYSEVAGSSNVEWDAVGTTRNFLKYWLSNRETLESISGHYDSGEPLPGQILDNLCNIHRHMAGTKMCHLIYLSNLDLDLHTKNRGWFEAMTDLWHEHMLFPLHEANHQPCGFQDIITGPWGGCYYSEIWSQMLAADVFSAFVKDGLINHEEMSTLGRRFRSTFLSLGGGCESKEIFRRFLGRDPTPKSLIEFLRLGDGTPRVPIVDSKPLLKE